MAQEQAEQHKTRLCLHDGFALGLRELRDMLIEVVFSEMVKSFGRES